MQAYEAPKALKYHVLGAHVRHRVYQADAVEGELYEVAFAIFAQVVARKRLPILFLWHVGIYE